jgi:hypothetical protein
MALFGKKKPQTQGYASVDSRPDPPQNIPPVPPPMPSFEDPEDITRWQMVHALRASLADMMTKNTECFEKAELAEKAIAMGNAEFVDGIRQHEISRENFRNVGVRKDTELEGLLVELRSATALAQSQWDNLLFLLPGSDNDVMKIFNWCESHGVDTEISGAIIAEGMFVRTDFGLPRASFWAENERINAVMNAGGQ